MIDGDKYRLKLIGPLHRNGLSKSYVVLSAYYIKSSVIYYTTVDLPDDFRPKKPLSIKDVIGYFAPFNY